MAVALGAFLAGRGVMNPWVVFGLTWGANVMSAAGVYLLARRYGRAVFRGRLGARLLSAETLDHIAAEYRRHGEWGIFVSRLLPVWRGVVMPFAGIAGVGAWRALVPLAAASAVYYGLLIALITRLGTNADAVIAAVGRVNAMLGIVALALAAVIIVLVLRRQRAP